MPRVRSPNRDKAFEIYKEHDGNITNREIADMLDENEKTISNWKCRDKWNVVLQINECSTTNKKTLKSSNKNKKEKPIAEKVKEALENADITDKQRLFCIYYIQYFNGTKAYQKAYQCDYKTAMINASRMLRNAKVKEEIEKIRKAINEELFYDIVDLIRELIERNNASICDYINFKNVEENVGTKNNPIYMNVTYTELKEEFEADPKFIKEIYYTKRGPMVTLKEADKLLKDILLEQESNKIKLKKIDAEIEYMNKKTEEIEGRLF